MMLSRGCRGAVEGLSKLLVHHEPKAAFSTRSILGLLRAPAIRVAPCCAGATREPKQS